MRAGERTSKNIKRKYRGLHKVFGIVNSIKILWCKKFIYEQTGRAASSLGAEPNTNQLAVFSISKTKRTVVVVGSVVYKVRCKSRVTPSFRSKLKEPSGGKGTGNSFYNWASTFAAQFPRWSE